MSTPQEFISNYEAALSTQEWKNIAPLIHKDCVATFSEGTYYGKSEVEAAFRKTFDFIKEEKYNLSQIHWVQVTDTFAVLCYIFSWSGLIEGKPASGSGRGSSVLINQDGNWQLLCEHLGPLARK